MPIGRVDFYFGLFSLVLAFLFGVLLLRLRFQSENLPMTNSQRWALTILGCLYLLNCWHIAGGWVFNPPLQSMPDVSKFINGINQDFNFMVCLPLLLFGLVYPRPVMRWSRMKFLMAGLSVLYVLLFLVNIGKVAEPVSMMGSVNPMIYLVYGVSCFVPIFIWIPEYDRQESPQMRMILTMLIWGYFMYFLIGEGSTFFYSIYNEEMNILNSFQVGVIAVVIILLVKNLYNRKGAWRAPEWSNAVILLSTALAAVVLTVMRIASEDYEKLDPNNHLWKFIFFVLILSPWMHIRPLLFSYGLLKHQSFGHKVKAEKQFIYLGAFLLSFATILVIDFNLAPKLSHIGTIIALVIGGSLFFPYVLLMRKLIAKILPMADLADKASLSQRRAAYLMGMQTAVVDGEVHDEYDREALEQLRNDLDISQREHELLIEGFVQEKPQAVKLIVEEVFLFYKDSSLIEYVSRYEDIKTNKGDMGNMITTVSNFFRDSAFQEGEVVESIEYGENTLIIEVTRELGLVVMLKGRDSPEIRQSMRDTLWSVRDKYLKDIKAMKQTGQTALYKQRLKGLDILLRRLMED